MKPRSRTGTRSMKVTSRTKFTGSRFQECEICGMITWCEPHHVFAGTARRTSDEVGAVAYCCRACHDNIHAFPARYRWLQEQTQRRVMQEQGWSLEDWMARFYKNYIEAGNE